MEQLAQQRLPENNDDVLMVRRADQWIAQASGRAVPLQLFGKFWHQGEVCILFADSNLGKSIVAVQIADAIVYWHLLALAIGVDTGLWNKACARMNG